VLQIDFLHNVQSFDIRDSIFSQSIAGFSPLFLAKTSGILCKYFVTLIYLQKRSTLPTGGVVNVGPAAAVGTVGHVVDAPPFVHPHMDNQFSGDLVVEYYIIRSLVLQDFDLTLA